MEDSHIAIQNLPGNVSVFGVFDGHGGAEVALYVKKHFIIELKANANFISKNYEKALYETFFRMDEKMLSPEGQKEISSYMERSVDESMAGCTANVVLITETEIYCANAGDSRSIIKFGSVKF
jgi:serine/threonine protein phosphatase PrpC